MTYLPQDLLPELALRRLAERYAFAADRRDSELFAAQFTEEGELIAPRGHFVGRAQLRTVPALLARYDRTFHAVFNQVVAFTGGQAEGVTYCIARHFFRDSAERSLCYEMTIRYQDQFRLGAEGWRIARRELVTDATCTFAVDAPAR